MLKSYSGYRRANGRAGIRNHVLLLPCERHSNQLAWAIEQQVASVVRFQNTGDLGRKQSDRERLYRIMLGVALNPNVHSVVLISLRGNYAYPECRATRLREALAPSGKPIEWLMVDEQGGVGSAIAEGVRMARRLVREASAQEREPIEVGDLTLGIKCGVSDGTSGISGNPTLGKAVDRVIGAGGSAIFSETTEVIGAESLLASRTSPEIAEQLYSLIQRTEDRAKGIGEDIRTINPIPSNIKAGLSTLEEKSMGAVVKGGTTPLRGVLEHAERHEAKGLFFMDGWMASNSLPIALAASGAQLIVFQMGGNDLAGDMPPPSTNPALVAPMFLMSGNPNVAKTWRTGLDFDSSAVLTGEKSLDEVGLELYDTLRKVANGMKTWGETSRFQENVEVWFDGPFL